MQGGKGKAKDVAEGGGDTEPPVNEDAEPAKKTRHGGGRAARAHGPDAPEVASDEDEAGQDSVQ